MYACCTTYYTITHQYKPILERLELVSIEFPQLVVGPLSFHSPDDNRIPLLHLCSQEHWDVVKKILDPNVNSIKSSKRLVQTLCALNDSLNALQFKGLTQFIEEKLDGGERIAFYETVRRMQFVVLASEKLITDPIDTCFTEEALFSITRDVASTLLIQTFFSLIPPGHVSPCSSCPRSQ